MKINILSTKMSLDRFVSNLAFTDDVLLSKVFWKHAETNGVKACSFENINWDYIHQAKVLHVIAPSNKFNEEISFEYFLKFCRQDAVINLYCNLSEMERYYPYLKGYFPEYFI